MNNHGKIFEQVFKEDWLKIPNSDILRLIDTTSGYKTISNPCDFVGYVYPFIFYLECKSTQGNTFPFQRLTQLEKLSKKRDIIGVNPGVIIWFIDHKKVCWVPIEEFIRLKEEGYKSINIKMLNDEKYKIIDIPSKEKRVYLESDYSCLIEWAKNKLKSNIEPKIDIMSRVSDLVDKL